MSLFLLLALGCADAPVPVQPPPEPVPVSAPLDSVVKQSAPVPDAAPPGDGSDTVFLVPAQDGWLVLGCLDLAARAEEATACRARLPKRPLVAVADGGTLQLTEALPLHCPTTEDTVTGLGPVPGTAPPPVAWWPPRPAPFWLAGARSDLRSDRVPEVRKAALEHFHALGHTDAVWQDLEIFRVSRGDLDHDGQEDLLAEASLPTKDPTKPRPTALFRVEGSTSLLTAEGLETRGRVELAGAWDPGRGSALLLLQSFWTEGMGSHLVGFRDGEPILLGQWVCGP